MSQQQTNNKFGIVNLPEVPDSIDNAFKNLTDSSTKNIGNTFGDIWYLVFGGISHAADKRRLKYSHNLELFKAELSNAISKIPSENKIEPSIQVTAQALENSKYCIDQENLRKMFTSLISNSLNSDFQTDIHPSFAEIIKQMAPLDAEIINVFKNSPITGFALCRYELKENRSYKILLENVFLKYKSPDLAACSIAISSLTRLGLLKTSYDEHLADKNLYSPFIEHFWFKKLQQEFPHQNVSIQRGVVSLTPLGRSFIRVCIPD